MRILLRWIGATLPFVEVGEAVTIGILIENVAILDRQGKLFEPVVRHWRMDLCVLQGCRQTICSAEMSFRNEKSGARAGLPWRRVLELLCGAIEFNRNGGRGGSFLRRRLLRDQAVPELDGVPPNPNRGNEKEDRCRDERAA